VGGKISIKSGSSSLRASSGKGSAKGSLSSGVDGDGVNGTLGEFVSHGFLIGNWDDGEAEAGGEVGVGFTSPFGAALPSERRRASSISASVSPLPFRNSVFCSQVLLAIAGLDRKVSACLISGSLELAIAAAATFPALCSSDEDKLLPVEGGDALGGAECMDAERAGKSVLLEGGMLVLPGRSPSADNASM